MKYVSPKAELLSVELANLVLTSGAEVTTTELGYCDANCPSETGLSDFT